MRRTGIAAVVVILLAALSTACGGNDGGKEQTKLLLLSQQTPFTAPSYMAAKLGYYKDAGLDVEIRAFPTGTTALEAWKSGIGDVIYSGSQPALLEYGSSQPPDYRMIQMATRSTGDMIIMARSSITSAADLKGKTIATRIGSTSEWWLERYLTHYHLSTHDVKIINLDPQQIVPAIDKGQIDAFALYQPIGWQAEAVAGDKVHQLADASEVPGVSDLTSYGARPSVITKDPGAVKKFVEATRKGAEYVAAHPDETADYYKSAFGADVNDTVRTLKFFDFDPAFDEPAMQGMKDLVDWSVQHGQLKKPVDLDDVIWPDAVK